MIVLEDDQLPELASELANDFPSSLYVSEFARNLHALVVYISHGNIDLKFPVFQVHSLVTKKARGKLSWPGISFVVDSFPNFTVCVARTDPAAAEKVLYRESVMGLSV